MNDERKRIVVTVDRMGNSVVEAQGYQGAECETATAGIERALGGAARRDHKPEFYEQPEAVEVRQRAW